MTLTDAIWLFSFDGGLHYHFMVPDHPHLSAEKLVCGIVKRLSKKADNSASYPFNSWSMIDYE